MNKQYIDQLQAERKVKFFVANDTYYFVEVRRYQDNKLIDDPIFIKMFVDKQENSITIDDECRMDDRVYMNFDIKFYPRKLIKFTKNPKLKMSKDVNVSDWDISIHGESNFEVPKQVPNVFQRTGYDMDNGTKTFINRIYDWSKKIQLSESEFNVIIIYPECSMPIFLITDLDYDISDKHLFYEIFTNPFIDNDHILFNSVEEEYTVITRQIVANKARPEKYSDSITNVLDIIYEDVEYDQTFKGNDYIKTFKSERYGISGEVIPNEAAIRYGNEQFQVILKDLKSDEELLKFSMSIDGHVIWVDLCDKNMEPNTIQYFHSSTENLTIDMVVTYNPHIGFDILEYKLKDNKQKYEICSYRKSSRHDQDIFKYTFKDYEGKVATYYYNQSETFNALIQYSEGTEPNFDVCYNRFSPENVRDQVFGGFQIIGPFMTPVCIPYMNIYFGLGDDDDIYELLKTQG